MIADQVRMPDLWLKRALALALLPDGKQPSWLTGKTLMECLRGGGSEQTLNHLIAGDYLTTVNSDLYYFAATMEYLVLHGASERFGRKDIERFASERGEQLALWRDPVLGTYSDFANALCRIGSANSHTQLKRQKAMAAALRQNLQDALDNATDAAGALRLLWGKTRNWALTADGLERIIRQPMNDTPEIPVGDFVQIVVPPAATAQWVFGFELRTDDDALSKPWQEVGGWFAPRYQSSGCGIALLQEYVDDVDNPVATEPGEFRICIIGVEAPEGANVPPALPNEMRALLRNPPEGRPNGYAEAIATVTYANRRDRERKKKEGKKVRNDAYLEPTPAAQVSVPSRAKLYSTIYRVIEG